MQRFAVFFIFGLLLTIVSCASSNDTNSQLDERMALFDEKEAIQELVFNTKCTEGSACKYIAFGSKPCGGPWFYLVYNSSIEAQVKAKVEAYNKQETAFNKKYNISSDCTMVMPPTRVTCEEGQCIPIYE